MSTQKIKFFQKIFGKILEDNSNRLKED